MLLHYDAQAELANNVCLEDGNFVKLPEIWTQKCAIIIGPVISMVVKKLLVYIRVLEYSWAHIYLFVAPAYVFLLKHRHCNSSKS